MAEENPKIIIGLVGSLASGKGVVTDYLISHYGFVSFSLSRVVHQEVKDRGITEISRKILQDVGDDLRQKYGGDVLAKKFLEILKKEGNGRAVLEGIRNPAEVDSLRKFSNFILISVDADRSLRFRRLIDRGKPWDPKDWESFLKTDERDLGLSQAEFGQQVQKCIDMADYKLLNNQDLKSLYLEIEAIISQIKKKKIDL